MKRRSLLLGAVAALALPVPALCLTGGGEFYVDSRRGDDRNPGSFRLPVRTIQAGARLPGIGPGAVVYIADGVYPKAVHIGRGGAEGRPVLFRAENPGGAIIDASRLAGIPLHIAAPYVDCWGLEVIGNRHKAGVVIAVNDGAGTHHVGLSGMTVHGAGGSGIYARRSDWLRFIGNTVYGCAYASAGSAISVHWPVELAGGTGPRILIRANQLSECIMLTGESEADPNWIPHTDGQGVCLDDWEHWRYGGKPYRLPALVERNIIWGNGNNGILNFHGKAPHMIRDNITYGNGADPFRRGNYSAGLADWFSEGATWLRNVSEATNPRHAAASCLAGSPTWIGNTLFASGPGARIFATNGDGLQAGNSFRDPGFVDPPRDFRRRA